jgi:excinuclease ABC subunit A
VTGVSGSGKSSLVSQVLVDLVTAALGHAAASSRRKTSRAWQETACRPKAASSRHGRRAALVRVDQKPIGRTPRSNLATYTGLFDQVRKLFAATRRRASAATMPGAFPSTSPRAAASTARARAS